MRKVTSKYDKIQDKNNVYTQNLSYVSGHIEKLLLSYLQAEGTSSK